MKLQTILIFSILLAVIIITSSILQKIFSNLTEENWGTSLLYAIIPMLIGYFSYSELLENYEAGKNKKNDL